MEPGHHGAAHRPAGQNRPNSPGRGARLRCAGNLFFRGAVAARRRGGRVRGDVGRARRVVGGSGASPGGAGAGRARGAGGLREGALRPRARSEGANDPRV